MAAEQPLKSSPRGVILLSTAGSFAAAEQIARALVESRSAACVNIIDRITSIYRWEGAVQKEPESLLLIKTTAEKLEQAKRLLFELHPYDVPECVVIEADRIAGSYLQWLVDSTSD
jgi:periplasmic divalent cation tolerance protein